MTYEQLDAYTAASIKAHEASKIREKYVKPVASAIPPKKDGEGQPNIEDLPGSCPDCGHAWEKHDFGVPKPDCP